MGKAPDAFRTISEVAEWLDVAPHVLRFWESKFTQVKPVKRAGGRRYYRPGDMQLLGGIKVLLHDQGQTIKAVQSMIREEGVAAVSAHSPMIDGAEDVVEGTAEAVADDNVVAFEPAEPREAAPADEPHTEPASTEDAPSQEPAVADAADDTAEPETTEPEQEIEEPEVAAAPAPKPLIIDIPEIASDTPDYAALPVSALSLSQQTDKTRLASKAKEIAPLVSRLEALRAEMTAHGAR